MQLFLDRIERVRPEFDLTDDLIDPAIAIVRRLDGLPLALELAAASTLTLTLHEIATQLDNRFEMLTHGSRTALDRQKTLWGAIDWSYGLLGGHLRPLFRRLGAFQGEFDVESIQSLFESDGGSPENAAALVAKSLVAPTASGRLRLLESIRAYARQLLAEAGEIDEVVERHARWFAAAVLEPQTGPTWSRDPEGIDIVHDDVVASLLWAADHDGPLALSLLEPLDRYWTRRTRLADARTLADRTLRATAAIDSKERSNALRNIGVTALMQGDPSAARTYFEEAAAVIGRCSGAFHEQIALGNLGMIAAREGDFETAEELLDRAVAILRRSKESRPLSIGLLQSAEVARMRGDLDAALERGTEALTLARADGNQSLAFQTTTLLGGVAHQRGDVVTARACFSEALSGARSADDAQPVIYLLFCLATLELDAGRPAAAAPLLAEAIELGRDADARADLAESLEATARVALDFGEPFVSCRLLAAVDVLRNTIGFPRPPSDSPTYDALIAVVRERCGDGGFEREQVAGAELDLDGAIALSLRVLGT
jgi:predicted ATPase